MNRDKYECNSHKELREICHEWYNIERSCYSILSKDAEFNSCYFDQNFDKIMITTEELYIMAKGYFNLSRCVEKVLLPKDGEHMRYP